MTDHNLKPGDLAFTCTLKVAWDTAKLRDCTVRAWSRGLTVYEKYVGMDRSEAKFSIPENLNLGVPVIVLEIIKNTTYDDCLILFKDQIFKITRHSLVPVSKATYIRPADDAE